MNSHFDLLKNLFSLSSSKLLKPSLNWFLFIISCIQSDVAHRCLSPQIQSFLPSIWFVLLLLFLCHHHLQRHLIFPLSCQWHNDKVVRSRKFPDKKGKNFQLWIICQIVDGKRNKTEKETTRFSCGDECTCTLSTNAFFLSHFMTFKGFYGILLF